MNDVTSPQPMPNSAPSDAAVDTADAATNTATESHGAVEAVSLKKPTSWCMIQVKPRVDSFNQDALIEEIKLARAEGAQKVALDLRGNRFLSFPVIRHCVSAAQEMAEVGGEFALIGCSEKTKRHFEIYGSLKHIRVLRSEQDLERVRSANA